MLAEGQPTLTLDARARAVLDAHCAPCRERHAESGTLDLAAVAADLALIVPRLPDQSRAYQRLLSAQAAARGRKQEEGAPPLPPAPSATEIETMRDWIESLPPRDAECRDRAVVTPTDVERLIDRWVESVGVAEAKDTRFVSLVHLWNACADEAQIAAYRSATETLLAGLARLSEPLEIETLGDESALLAVRLSGLSLDPAEWDRMLIAAPRGAESETIPADWLASHILASADEGADETFDVRFDGVGQRAVEALAAAWNGDVDLIRAAAERGTARRALALALSGLGDDHRRAAMRLLHGSIGRDAWNNLSRALDGTANAATPWKRETEEGEIDVLLWTDKPIYRPRDLVTAHVVVNSACHLTLISIDRDGKALVLFPNELEQDNLIPAGTAVSIPGRDAGYQLRLDWAGEESMVAVCERGAQRLDGVFYDYERQRFASLGDWRAFLRNIPEREKEIVEAEEREANRRRRRGRKEPPLAPTPVESGDKASGRAAIAITIERAGGP